jgi:FlaA1/EpsC-like NDP-sugar epimerase
MNFFSYIINISRVKKQLLMGLFDSLLLIFIIFASVSYRLEELYITSVKINWVFFISPVIALPIFYQFGLYKSTIRYIGFQELWSIVQAVSLYSLIWGIFLYLFPIYGMPRSVIGVNFLFSTTTILGLRMIARWLLTVSENSNNLGKKNVLVYGAGAAGRQLIMALSHSIEYKPIALIDDAIELQGQLINGLEVFAPNNLEKLIQKKRVTEVLIAIPDLSRSRRKKIISLMETYRVLVRVLPSVTELAQGKVTVEDLRVVDIKDLLGRDSVSPNNKLLKVKITNKVVMVTGAGGSIGSELCRQILKLQPKELILFELTEYSLYQIEQELLNINPMGTLVTAVLGSIKDYDRVTNTFKLHKVQTIYHTAAYKHVPLVESNPSEGVLNNVFGTLTLAKASIEANVETFVLISSDKAVRPTNTMGATKRVSELITQAFSKENSDTCFTMVRFGNVLDSSGSVIPLFKKQIKKGGPVTVTDIDVIRYFMTVTEAVELVIQAGAMAEGGDLFVLDMGEPIRINDLAKKMIQLSGLQVCDDENPQGDIKIKYVGLRPGEKLYEELLVNEHVFKTKNPLIMRADESMIDWPVLKPILDELHLASKTSNQKEVREILVRIVPEFNPKI